MNKVQHLILGTTKYFKFREEGTDNWYAGKTDRPTIPKGAIAISLYNYLVMSYGKAATMRALKELKKIEGISRKGSIVFPTEQNISHLPNANDSELLKKLTGAN